MVNNVSDPFPHTTSEWFNPAIFAGGCNNAVYATNPYCVPLGTFGNAARDIFHGPGTIQWDMSASRIFRFSERFKLQFKAEFFNELRRLKDSHWHSASHPCRKNKDAAPRGLPDGAPRVCFGPRIR